MATWEHLGAIEIDSLERRVRAATVHPVIAVAVDVDALDVEALREHVSVRVVELEDLCL